MAWNRCYGGCDRIFRRPHHLLRLPYNGALSWKIDELRNKRKVELKHNNFFESGVEGVLSDLDEALGLPDELYVTDQFQMTFKSDGTIRSIYAFLYGKDAEEKYADLSCRL